jgi:hypothetical protein
MFGPAAVFLILLVIGVATGLIVASAALWGWRTLR